MPPANCFCSAFKYLATRLLISFMLVSPLLFSNAYALSDNDARHLLSRTGFSPSFAEIKPYQPLNRTQAIQARIDSLSSEPQSFLPETFQLPIHKRPNFKTASREEKKAYRKTLRQQTNQLKIWWLNEMLHTDSPFTENLTLFWHNHFVSSSQKVKNPALMANQNQTLRQYAAGNYRDFVTAMLKDPALIRYLDNQRNRKGKPNENLGRELLELFTLGEGHYSEADVKNAAKALTGLSVNPKTGEFRFLKKAHDNGVKTLFGETGRWNADDLVRLILKQPQAARFITQALWQHFITTPIPEKKLQQLSQAFYKNYELKPLIKNILSQPEFWSDNNRGTQIKAPVNLVVGVYRQFDYSPKKSQQLVKQIKSMGQDLFTPPNVKGWETGNGWINATSLLARQTFLANVTRGMQIQKLVARQQQNELAWQNLLLAKQLQLQLHSEENNQAMTPKPTKPPTWQKVKNTLNHLHYQLE